MSGWNQPYAPPPEHMEFLLMTRTSLLAAALFASASLVSVAHAQEASTTFDVLITIESTCSIDTPAATDVDFGAVESTATDVEAEGTLSVNCTPDTSYDIALDGGLNGGGDVAARAMSGPGGLVPYQLYSDAARTVVWGQTVDTDAVTGIGTGDVQEYTVYGLVPSTNFSAGDYTDTVTATVIW